MLINKEKNINGKYKLDEILSPPETMMDDFAMSEVLNEIHLKLP